MKNRSGGTRFAKAFAPHVASKKTTTKGEICFVVSPAKRDCYFENALFATTKLPDILSNVSRGVKRRQLHRVDLGTDQAAFKRGLINLAYPSVRSFAHDALGNSIETFIMDSSSSASSPTPLWDTLRQARELLLDAIFPPRCAGCGCFESNLFCAHCASQLQPIVPPLCYICGAPFDVLAKGVEICADCRANRYQQKPPFAALRSAYLFDGPLRKAAHRFKYRGKTGLAAPLAALLEECLKNQNALDAPIIPWQELKLIVPVPLSSWRRYRRGYNQSALLARELARLLDVPFGEVLQRARHTPPQVGLSRRQRADNVRGAFALNAPLEDSQKAGAILLVDDVYTTGATIRECAQVLRKKDATSVYALTLARHLSK